MDFVLNIFKHISTFVSPTELLVIICAVAAVAFFIVKFILGLMGKKGALGGLMGGDDEAIKKEKMHQLLNEKLSSLLAKDEFSAVIRKLQEDILDTIHQLNREQAGKIAQIFTKVDLMSSLKRDVESTVNLIQEDIRSIRHQMQMHDMADEKNFAAVKDGLQRAQESLNRVMIQVEKIDEFARAMVPEFRGHHKDLNSALAEISKDIALVERSIQTQITTANAVTLR